MARTIVTWNLTQLSEPARTTFRETAVVWASQGRTDGTFSAVPSTPPTDASPYVVTRTFTTVADAEDWINNVVLPLATPVNYVIEEN